MGKKERNGDEGGEGGACSCLPGKGEETESGGGLSLGFSRCRLEKESVAWVRVLFSREGAAA